MTLKPFASFLLLALVACQGPSDQGAGADGGAQATTEPTPAAAPGPSATTGAESPAERPIPERPKLVVTTFDGDAFDLTARRGRWVVVNFWATWCNPCLKEIPDLAAMDAAHEDIEVIGLAFEEIDKAGMQAFLDKRPIPYPIAIVDTFGPPTDFGTPRGLPTTYLIGPDGKVAATHLGPVTAAELLRDITAAGGKLASG
jgi:thiol-disulfide isomerase/thioredoxin